MTTLIVDTPTDTALAWLHANTRPTHRGGLNLGHIEAHDTYCVANETAHVLAHTRGFAAVITAQFDGHDRYWVVDERGHGNLIRWFAAHGIPFEEQAAHGVTGRARVVDTESIETPDGRRVNWTAATAARQMVPGPARMWGNTNNRRADEIHFDFTTGAVA